MSEQNEAVLNAFRLLNNYINELSKKANWQQDRCDKLWDKISHSDGLIKEFAYYYDTGNFLGEYKIVGYSITDILVWQVDHFKAYMDRHEDMNRYKPERLLLESFEVMANMEEDPEKYVDKMRGETGTDFVEKYK